MGLSEELKKELQIWTASELQTTKVSPKQTGLVHFKKLNIVDILGCLDSN